VPPTQQTLQGLAGQEALGTLAQQQMAATLGGQYLNPFLSPLIQNTAGNIYTNVAQQFSGAGRTPGSPMSQQQALSQVAQAALPLAFQEYGTERGRQLGLATQLPSVFQTGQQLEAIQRQQQLAPYQALQQYASFATPIASGFPTTIGSQQVQANPFSTALGQPLSSNLQTSYNNAKTTMNNLLGITPPSQQFGYSAQPYGLLSSTNVTSNPFNIDYLKRLGLI
jgi:hypothetical protein